MNCGNYENTTPKRGKGTEIWYDNKRRRETGKRHDEKWWYEVEEAVRWCDEKCRREVEEPEKTTG